MLLMLIAPLSAAYLGIVARQERVKVCHRVPAHILRPESLEVYGRDHLAPVLGVQLQE